MCCVCVLPNTAQHALGGCEQCETPSTVERLTLARRGAPGRPGWLAGWLRMWLVRVGGTRVAGRSLAAPSAAVLVMLLLLMGWKTSEGEKLVGKTLARSQERELGGSCQAGDGEGARQHVRLAQKMMAAAFTFFSTCKNKQGVLVV